MLSKDVASQFMHILNRFEARMATIADDLVTLSTRIAALKEDGGKDTHDKTANSQQNVSSEVGSLSAVKQEAVALPALIPSLPPESDVAPALRHLLNVGDQIQCSLLQLKFMALDGSQDISWKKLAEAQQGTLAVALASKSKHKKTDSTRPAAAGHVDEEVLKQKEIIAELRRQASAAAARAARNDELRAQGRVLASVSLPTNATEASLPIPQLFTRFAGSADSVVIKEPYLVSDYQVDNITILPDAFVVSTHVRKV